MSKQMRQYIEATEQEQRELEIMRLLDEAYEIEHMNREMINEYNRQVDSRLASREYSNHMAIEYGYTAA